MELVIGLGGGGSKIVDAIAAVDFEKRYCAIDSDTKALSKLPHCKSVLVGTKTCEGWGAGSSFEVGEMALTESYSSLVPKLISASAITIVTTLGGGIGGSVALLASWIKELHIPIRVVTVRPFLFEGRGKRISSLECERRLLGVTKRVHSFENQQLLSAELKSLPMIVALGKMNEMISKEILEPVLV